MINLQIRKKQQIESKSEQSRGLMHATFPRDSDGDSDRDSRHARSKGSAISYIG